MNKRIKTIISTLCVLALTASVSMTAMADADIDLENYQIKAMGGLVHDYDGSGVYGDHPSDVVYDADDITTISNMVKTGKKNLSAALNSYPNTKVASIDTFANLTTAVETLTAVPDIYYYDKATEGEGCVRYMLIDGAYYPCDQYGVQTSEEALTGTITVIAKDDATEPAEGEIQLVKYEKTSAENLSAGFAGYADKSFILGSGVDNITYKNMGGSIYYLGMGNSFCIADIVGSENIDKYNEDNFLVSWSAPSGGSAKVNNVYEPGTHSSYTSVSVTGMVNDFIKVYDSSTGYITITGGTYKISMTSYNPAIDERNNASAICSVTPVVYFIGNCDIVNTN